MIKWKSHKIIEAFSTITLTFLSTHLYAAEYIGSWDLRGIGQQDAVFRDAGTLQVVQGDGVKSTYNFGNTIWSFVGAIDTDGTPGAELIIKGGSDLYIVDQKIRNKRSYPVGNISWAVMAMQDLNSKAGSEVVLSIGNGVKIIDDQARSSRNLTFNYNGAWALFGISILNPVDGGPDLILNMGNGVKLINPRNGNSRDITFAGYSQITAISEVDGAAGNDVIGRTTSDVYVISGGVSSGKSQAYRSGTNAAWAIYEKIVDTDGNPGNEIILIKTDGIGVIHPASGRIAHYRIPGTGYSIQGTANMNADPGEDIIVKNSANQTFVINDRAGTVK